MSIPSRYRAGRQSVALGRPSLLQAAAIGALVIAVPYVFAANHFTPVDTYSYLAAGERLNVGHDLYALSPGDRLLLPQMEGYTLLYPPAIAVLWRPLAALGEWTVYPWWLVTMALTLGTAFGVLVVRPVAGSVAVVILFAPVAFLAVLGNVNSIVLAAGCAAWFLGRDSRWNAASAMLGFVTAIKPTALPLLCWAASRGRPPARGLVGSAAGLGLGFGIGLLAGGPQVYLEWLTVAATNAGGADTTLSPAHLAPWLPSAILAIGSLATVILPRRPAFIVALIATTFGSPAVTVGSLAFLVLAALVTEEPVLRHPARPEIAPTGSVDRADRFEGGAGQCLTPVRSNSAGRNRRHQSRMPRILE